MKGSGSRDTATTPDRIRFRLRGKSVLLDRRIHALRNDLADISLADIHFSAHYARARALGCAVPGTPVRSSPSLTAETATQLLHGDTFHALDITTDWVWGFCGHDGYVGYVRRDALDEQELATHRVTAMSASVFASPDIKSPVMNLLPIGASLRGEEEGAFVTCAEGYVHLRHLVEIDQFEQDWVSAGEKYLGQPYLWGGRGQGGIDCSGLVQMALARCGLSVPRDTDLQREGIGQPIAEDGILKRGDLIFFPGHVGMMTDDMHLLHANAFWMATVIEPLADVVERLKATHEQPIIARRRIG